MSVIHAFHCWLNGWRRDVDGWWVRARRATDPDLSERPELGFTEEASIAVRSREIAMMIDDRDLFCIPVQP